MSTAQRSWVVYENWLTGRSIETGSYGEMVLCERHFLTALSEGASREGLAKMCTCVSQGCCIQ